MVLCILQIDCLKSAHSAAGPVPSTCIFSQAKLYCLNALNVVGVASCTSPCKGQGLGLHLPQGSCWLHALLAGRRLQYQSPGPCQAACAGVPANTAPARVEDLCHRQCSCPSHLPPLCTQPWPWPFVRHRFEPKMPRISWLSGQPVLLAWSAGRQCNVCFIACDALPNMLQ